MEDISRQLFNQDLSLRAYGRLYRHAGAMTPGATAETVDGMSFAKIEALLDDIRHARYRWTPVRRPYVPKKSGKFRPLGLPTWRDKLLQEVIRSIWEAYYAPQFRSHSHGCRPDRGCHPALRAITPHWRGVKWFLEGAIPQCFDRLDPTVLLSMRREKLHDTRLLRLMTTLCKAGYLEDWTSHPTLSGVPQGGVCSPGLMNIYLDRLDQFVETVLLPRDNRGHHRKRYQPSMALLNAARRKTDAGQRDQAKRLRHQAQSMPSRDPADPTLRRLWYVRYAEDTLLGFSGPRAEAEAMKGQLPAFLRDTLK